MKLYRNLSSRCLTQLRKSALCQRRKHLRHPGMAGAQRHLYYAEHLYSFGLHEQSIQRKCNYRNSARRK